jgi:tetratricopeptide (TPR) repeat protein
MLVLVAAIANLHHFVLDGAIWKLRGRIAQVLIQSQPDAQAEPRRTSWLGRAAWAACALALVAYGAGALLEDAWIRAVRERDLAAAREALHRLHWVGRDRGSYHLAIARGLLQVGAPEAARAEALRAVADGGALDAQIALGQASFALGRNEEAAHAFEAASALAPERTAVRRAAARAWREAGDLARAEQHLEAAAQLAPGSAQVQRELARVRAARALADRSAGP